MKKCIPQSSVSTRFLCITFLFAFVLLLSSPFGQAQSAAATGRLEGTVTDSSGAAATQQRSTLR
jgi:hypothetical protein